MVVAWKTRKCKFHGKIGLILVLSLGITELSSFGGIKAAQTSADERRSLPEFEVVSVKPSPPPQRGEDMSAYPGGRIVATYYTVRGLISVAFHLQDFRISGGPHWIVEDRFHIEAKPPASSRSSKSIPSNPKMPPNDEQRQMLQALLIDRFQLKCHREMVDKKIHVLTLSGRKLKLEPAKNPDEFPWAGGIGGGYPDGCGLRGMAISMPQLAERLTRWLHHPVLDKTGLQGRFDFEFQTGEGDYTSDTEIVLSIVVALKGLGLALKPAECPVETLVIDRIEKPSEN